jgi:hypothetical protein
MLEALSKATEKLSFTPRGKASEIVAAKAPVR